MNAHRLSPEIVSLIHHVELNESGWWKKAVGQVIKAGLWTRNAALTITELQIQLKRDLGVKIPEPTIITQLQGLGTQGAVITLPDGRVKLSEQTRNELTIAHSLAEQEKKSCEAIFFGACEKYCPDLPANQVFEEFTRSLQRSVQIAGANLFHLIVDGKLERDIDWLAPFLLKFGSSQQEGLRAVLGAFFAPGNLACRNQILRVLSARFFAEASQLSTETLKLIEAERKKKSIKLVLDTNFLFSILQLHDNPGDESAHSLIEVAKNSGHSLELKLYVLPSTLEEAKRALVSQVRLIESLRVTMAMSRASMNMPMPSIAKKFLAAAKLSPGLKAAEFFRPYIDDLQTVLKGKGINVLDAHPSRYNVRPDVIDDVMSEKKREEAEVPEGKRKGYETLLHDAVLWHAVNDRRNANDNSPFEVEYWAVSIDWRLIALDRQKRLSNVTHLPVVLHPSNLMQFIQFWIPRTSAIDEVLVDSLRLPLYFQSFDPDDERATVRVLSAISRFENINDISESTMKLVLANQVLRGRIKEGDASNDEIYQLVREEFLAIHKATASELTGKIGELNTVSEEVERVSDSLKSVNREKELVEIERDKAHGELAFIRYAVKVMLVPAIASVVCAYVAFYFTVDVFSKDWLRFLFVLGVGLVPPTIGVLLSPSLTRDDKYLSGYRVVKFFNYLGAKGNFLITVTSGAIFAGAVWDGVKYLAGIGS